MGTKSNLKVSISGPLVNNADLADIAAFEGLTWTEIKGVGDIGEYGNNAPVVTYAAYRKKFKGKGTPDFGDPELQVRRISGDTGQNTLRTAGEGKRQYAFKVEFDDATGAAVGDYTATVDYLKGVVSGPRRPQGGDEDFILDLYALGIEQFLTDQPTIISV